MMQHHLAAFLVVCLPLLSVGQDMSSQTCSRENSAVIQAGASAWLGGIISLNQQGTGGYGCGLPSGSMQGYEALRWVLDLLNKKGERLNGEDLTDYYVPGIKLGMDVRNYCNNNQKAGAALLDVYPQLGSDAASCSANSGNLTLGVVGPSRSDDGITLLHEAEKFEIPVVSYEATDPMLTMSGLHPTFMRTISPDGPLIDVIVDILVELKWHCIAVVYDEGTYGRALFSELQARLKDKDICLTVGVMINADLSQASTALDQVLNSVAVGAIYFGPSNFAKELLAQGNARLPASGRLQWLLTDFPVDNIFPSGHVYQRGIISVTAASRFIVEFEDHWIRIDEATHSTAPTENPWFTSWYEERNQCKFNPGPGEINCNAKYQGLTPRQIELKKREAYEQDQYVEAAVMSVFAYARALREAQRAKCIQAASGACASLLAMTREDFLNNYLKKVNLTFTKMERVPSLASDNVAPYNAIKRLQFNANGDIVNPSYYIWNFNDVEVGSGASSFKFRRVGSYINGRLNLNNVGMYSDSRQQRLPSLPTSLCPQNGSTPCLGLPADLKYYYEPGDAVINGLFSLHAMGLTPLSCGPAMSANQFQYLEAMIYAINKINADNTILRNVKLGGLGLDDCSSSILGQAYVVQVQRGNVQIKDAQGDVLDPLSIEAYTAAYNTPLTEPLAHAMNMLLKPMVGYRASGGDLLDGQKYPYYLVSTAGIKAEMLAIVLLLKRQGWHYVQVIANEDPYSSDAEEVFRELAAQHGICVVARHDPGTDTISHHKMVQRLMGHSSVQPVVSLLEAAANRQMLMAFNTNPVASRNFILIGTSRWGISQSVVQGYETIAEGAITLRPRHSTLEQFRQHLAGLDVQTYVKTNPWFVEWYEAVHNCSFSTTCDLIKAITDGGSFELLYQVESVINSVHAIARGLDLLLSRFCPSPASGVCKAFTNAAKGKDFVNALQALTFPIEDTNPPAMFRFNGRAGEIPFEIFRYVGGTYTKVGDVNPWLSTVTAISGTQQFKATCSSPCLECLYMFQHFNYWYIPGDLLLGAIIDVHYAGNGPFNCGAVRAQNGALYAELFKFALDKVNSDVLSSFSLGGLAFDGCTNPPRATVIVNTVHTGLERIKLMGEPFDVRSLISWMSYDSATTIQVAELLQALNMPLISPGATSLELNDKSKFHTFWRTIPSGSIIAKGMGQFVRQMGWPYVVTVNSPDDANREARDYFIEYLKGFGICVVASFEFETDGTNSIILNSIKETNTQVVAVFSEPDRFVENFVQTNADNAIFPGIKYIANRPWGKFTQRFLTSPPSGNNDLKDSVFFEQRSPTIADFTTYLSQQSPQNSSNPWLKATYEAWMNCNLPGSFDANRQPCDTRPITSNSNWEQDIWTLTTLNAVYSVAEAVKQHKINSCGANSLGICANFYQNPMTGIMNSLDAVNFTDITQQLFWFLNREADRNFLLMRYQENSSPSQEGVLDLNGTLTLAHSDILAITYKDVKSNCPGDCLVCTASDTGLGDFTLIDGNIYIVGLFDVHKKTSSPFTCGGINDKHGLPLLEAFNFAIEYVNNKEGIFVDKLPGVRLGGVALDTCQSPARAANLVANIHNGKVELSKGGITVNPKRIDAYIGTMDTESSIRVADILTQLAMPQISYGAMGVQLLDREKYNFFLRSVPADDKQARAIVSYLKKFKYNNIQVVYSFDEIGEPGLEEFEKVALANSICVQIKHLVGQSGHITATESAALIGELLATSVSFAEVVILWMKNPLPVLEAASASLEATQRLLFITTDKWGANPDYLPNPNLENLLRAQRLITLDVETADVPGYDRYLEHKTPDNYLRNPWFKEYFEVHQNCYWDTPSGSRTTPCDKSSTIPRADHYVQDPFVLYVVNAVFSAALGIDKALKTLCGAVSGDCNLYRTSGERRQNVMRGLLQVNFTDDTFQPFFYTPDGQSDRGFHIYNVTEPQRGEFVYTNVGSYNDTDFLKLDITYESQVSAVCDPDGINPNLPDCICPFPKKLPSRYMKKDDGNRGLSLVYIGDIHSGDGTIGCGAINTGPDLQRLLAFFYAINLVNTNADSTFRDSIRLNGLALDSCTHGLRLGQDVYNVLSGNQLCDADVDSELISPSSVVSFIIDKDTNAIPVSSMLSQYKITSISPTASHDQLSDRFMYPYFLRIRGDNLVLADVIMKIAKEAGWDFMSVIYSDNLSKGAAKNVLLEQSQANSVCFGEAEPLPMGAGLRETQLVLEKISRQVGARAVALLVEAEHLPLVMEASRTLGLTGRFIWIIPADWSFTGGNIAGFEQEVAGSIIIETRSAILQDFNTYMKSLTFTNRGGIPDDWFLEIYESLHQCNILRDGVNKNLYTRICSRNERITDAMLTQDPSVLHVIISVLATARGLEEIPDCRNSNLDVAACLQTLGERRYDAIYKGLQDVSFQVLPNLLGDQSFQFSFDENGEGQAGYIINNYRATGVADRPSAGGFINPYGSFNIGQYGSSGLSLDLSNFAGNNLLTRGTVADSSCPMEDTCTCKGLDGTTWDLIPPSNPEIIVGRVYEGPLSSEPILVRGIPSTGDRFDDIWAIIVTVIAVIGAVVSLAVFLYLLVMYPVRGGTSILGYMLTFGIILLYLMVFPFIAHADTQICGLRRFGLGFVYAVVYSALLVKLVDCWRVRGKEESYDAKYSKLGRPAGLFMVTVLFILVQVMINAEWLILEEPSVTREFYEGYYWPRCTDSGDYDKSLVMSLIYVMVLIVFSLLLGLVTFTSKKNHRESRWILGILILSIPCWVIWCLVATMGALKVRDAAVAIGLLVNATFMLLLVPIRKIYLLHKYNVLIEEEEEEREEARSQLAASQRGTDYNYGRQYDNNPRLQDSGSNVGSGY